jgi:hypothetical protein
MLPNQITPDHLATPRLVASSSRRGSCCSAAASSPPRRPPPAVRRRSAWTWRSPPAAEYSPLALSPPASSSTPRSPSSATPLQRFSTRWPLLSSVAPPPPPAGGMNSNVLGSGVLQLPQEEAGGWARLERRTLLLQRRLQGARQGDDFTVHFLNDCWIVACGSSRRICLVSSPSCQWRVEFVLSTRVQHSEDCNSVFVL